MKSEISRKNNKKKLELIFIGIDAAGFFKTTATKSRIIKIILQILTGLLASSTKGWMYRERDGG